jgi:hypothetical protein
MSIKLKNFRGWETLVCKELAVYPYFSSMMRYRMHNRLACNVVITGEPGIGKSYLACDIARVFEGFDYKGRDHFKVDQVVYFFSQYMDLLTKLKMGKSIVFDEPSYAMGKRDWYKDLNKVLVQTIESQRFMVHPLFIPIINQALLDKTIRAYLIQYRIHVVGRGHALVYRIKASQHVEKIYHYQICELVYKQFDSEDCDLPSCLGCKKMDSCHLFRAQYEKKKMSIQLDRYEQAKDQASRKESQDLTEQQLLGLILPHAAELKNTRSQIDMHKLKEYLRDKEGITISTWKAYNIKKALEIQHPELLEQSS